MNYVGRNYINIVYHLMYFYSITENQIKKMLKAWMSKLFLAELITHIQTFLTHYYYSAKEEIWPTPIQP